MTIREFIKGIPEDTILFIGSAKGSGWFYVVRAKNFESEIAVIDSLIGTKLYERYRARCYTTGDLRRMASPESKYVKGLSFKDYIKLWNKILYYEKSIPRFFNDWMSWDEKKSIDSLRIRKVIHKHIPEALGILVDDVTITGSTWTLEEWEVKHGKI